MATLTVDDFDGKTPVKDATRFSFKSVNYTIDLGPENLAKFEEVMAPYIKAAQIVGTSRSASFGSTRNAEIRKWAKAQGKDVKDIGAISREIQAEYDAAH